MAARPRPCRASGTRCLSSSRHRTGRGPPARLDRRGPPPGRSERARGMTTSPLAWFWGDDELSAARAVDRLASALATETGGPLERWEMRGTLDHAATQVAQINERVATPVMFGGGTLAVVTGVGALARTTE